MPSWTSYGCFIAVESLVLLMATRCYHIRVLRTDSFNAGLSDNLKCNPYAKHAYLRMKALLKKRTRTSAELHKADDKRDVAVARDPSQKHRRIAASADPSKHSCALRDIHDSHPHSLSVTTTRSSRKTVFTIHPTLRGWEKANRSSHSTQHVDLLCRDTLDILDAIDAADAVDDTHASKVQASESKSLSCDSQDKFKGPSDPSQTQRANLFQDYHINFAMLAILNRPDLLLLQR